MPAFQIVVDLIIALLDGGQDPKPDVHND
jgi:hypothetical protein